MPVTRYLTAKWWQNAVFGSLKSDARIAWQAIAANSDSAGVLRFDPVDIKGMAFPYDSGTIPSRCVAIYHELTEAKLLAAFQIDDTIYRWHPYVTLDQQRSKYPTFGNVFPPESLVREILPRADADEYFAILEDLVKKRDKRRARAARESAESPSDSVREHSQTFANSRHEAEAEAEAEPEEHLQGQAGLRPGGTYPPARPFSVVRGRNDRHPEMMELWSIVFPHAGTRQLDAYLRDFPPEALLDTLKEASQRKRVSSTGYLRPMLEEWKEKHAQAG